MASETIPGTLLVRPDILTTLDFRALFGTDAPVELELGAGDGSFLLRHAALHPGRCHLGVERLLGRLRKIDRKGRRLGLTNLRGLRLEAAYLLDRMIPAGSLAALHVYFPDPWPKKRHVRRRLVNDAFVVSAGRALATDGMTYVRTDHAEYFAQMAAAFDASGDFARGPEPEGLLATKTDFEAGFNARGLATLHAAWRRRPAPATPKSVAAGESPL